MGSYNTDIGDVDIFKQKCSNEINRMRSERGHFGGVFYISKYTGIKSHSIHDYISGKSIPNGYYLYLLYSYLRDDVRDGYESVYWFCEECGKAIKKGMDDCNIKSVSALARSTGISYATLTNYLSGMSVPNGYYLYLINKCLNGAIVRWFENEFVGDTSSIIEQK